MSEVQKNVVTPETNQRTTESMEGARVREIDFALTFSAGVKKLMEALGISRLVAKAAGTVIKYYKATGELVNNGNVPEGEIIPLTQIDVEAVPLEEATLKKWRKATTAEAIEAHGYDQAVSMTNDRMIRNVQKTIRASLIGGMASGTAAEGKTLQAVLAQTWGKLAALYEDMDGDIEPVHFVNPADIADYLSTAQVTTQTMFGMTYIQNFLGLGDVFTNTSVPAKHVYSTAKSNIIGYYVPANGSGIGEAFDFTTDETGMIGIHEFADYKDMTSQSTVVCGVNFFPEYAAGVVNGEIKASAAI